MRREKLGEEVQEGSKQGRECKGAEGQSSFKNQVRFGRVAAWDFCHLFGVLKGRE